MSSDAHALPALVAHAEREGGAASSSPSSVLRVTVKPLGPVAAAEQTDFCHTGALRRNLGHRSKSAWRRACAPALRCSKVPDGVQP